MATLLKIARCKIGQNVVGPMPVADFRKVKGFTLQTPVAAANSEAWKPAFEVIDLGDYFGSKKPTPAPGHVVDPVILQMLDALAPKADVATAKDTPAVICLPAKNVVVDETPAAGHSRKSRWLFAAALVGLVALIIGGFLMRHHRQSTVRNTAAPTSLINSSRMDSISEQRLPRRSQAPVGLRRSRRS